MYKKYVSVILMLNLVFAAAAFSINGIAMDRLAACEAYKLEFPEDFTEVEKMSVMGKSWNAASGQRVVDLQLLERKKAYELNSTDYENLLRIVEAEAGSEDEEGRLLVANVVLNRVDSPKFPNTVTGVVFQTEDGKAQFSPVSNGRIHSVRVSQKTEKAVERAIYGEDISQGALYFAAPKYAAPERMQWFRNHLTRLFTHGGHEFFA